MHSPFTIGFEERSEKATLTVEGRGSLSGERAGLLDDRAGKKSKRGVVEFDSEDSDDEENENERLPYNEASTSAKSQVLVEAWFRETGFRRKPQTTTLSFDSLLSSGTVVFVCG